MTLRLNTQTFFPAL